MILIASREEKAIVEAIRRVGGLDKLQPLADEVVRLKTQIATLDVERSKKEEAHAREERELRHMIGLEKKRQEVEIEQAKKATELSVKEANLAADKQRFADEMKFQRERFTEEVGYLKSMMKDILDRLPNINMELSRKVAR